MCNCTAETFFAPAARTDDAQIAEKSQRLEADRNFIQAINAIPELLAILDENRQMVMANRALIDAVGGSDLANVLGLRPGEAVQCRHASEMSSGCGTSETCRVCGAVTAILAAQSGCTEVRDCHISRVSGDAIDLRVKASPFDFDNRRYTILTLQDMADENRRRILERTFFHDILNSAGSVKGIVDLLIENGSVTDLEELSPLLSGTLEQLVHEIQAQRDLLAAEQGRLAIDREPLNSRQVVQDTARLYLNNPVSENRTIEIDPDTADLKLYTSHTLLLRVLGNMLKNALEASLPGEKVRLGCRPVDSAARFWVWNDTVIPRDVQLQLFKRSFSTKGSGRGIGTYSMMLLGEKYLGGKVAFSSREGDGTTFSVSLPLTPPEA